MTQEKKRYDDERAARMQDYYENSGSCYYCKTAGVSLTECHHCGHLFCLYHVGQRNHDCPPFVEAAKRERRENADLWAKWKKEKEEREGMEGWFLLLLFFALCGAFFIYVMPSLAQQYKPCMDNTTGQTCSVNKPYFCAAGQLVYSPERCGCPEGYMVEAGVCQKIQYRADGTIYGSCSANNTFCTNGSLILNASACGCPTGYMAEGGACQKIQYCTDGTVYGSCSSNKPFFCANGSLINNVSGCGCPYGSSIRQQGDRCIDLNQPDIPSFEQSIHDMINQQREENGLPALALDARLSNIARSHSEDMAKKGYFDHVTPEGVDPTGRGEAVGYICSKTTTYGIAENIFKTYTYGTTWYTNGVETSRDYLTPDQLTEQIVIGWMDSPGHRQNILTETYDAEGIGAYATRDGTVYVTEDFC
ncbi:MAG: CAP domain-containing protein [Candidatus ainarchaeum sp.]|nr:CAP domain-containing protein [Candidatus ainarchaeum sp.]